MAQCETHTHRSPFVHFARAGKSVEEVKAALGCSRRSAEKGLCEGRALLEGLTENEETASPNVEKAVALLRHSGSGLPEISRKRWTRVALGLTRVF